MKRFFRITLTALGIFVVVFFFAAITLRLALHAREVQVPDFSGMTVAQATGAALQTGLGFNIESKFYSTTVPAGRVLSQAPAAGSTVRHGWQVRVIESLGPQQVTIPDVVGQTLRVASLNLRRNALNLGSLAHIAAPGDPDMTLAQTPPPNAGVDQPRVNLLLSAPSGGAASAFVLPSWVGWSFPAANHAAIALGLRVAALGDVPVAPPAGATGSPGASAPSGVPAPGASSPPPGTTAGPNGTHLDAAGEAVAFLAAQTTPATPGAPATSAAPAAPPAPPPMPTGPVTAQYPESGFRASRGDVVRLTVGAPSPPPTTSAPAASGANAPASAPNPTTPHP